MPSTVIGRIAMHWLSANSLGHSKMYHQNKGLELENIRILELS